MINGEEKDGGEVGNRIEREGRRAGGKGGHSVLTKVGHKSGPPNSNQLIALAMP